MLHINLEEINLLLLILVDNIDGRIIIRYFYLLNLSGILRYLDT